MNSQSAMVRRIRAEVICPIDEIKRALQASNWIEEDAIALIENNAVPSEQELKNRILHKRLFELECRIVYLENLIGVNVNDK